MPYSKKSFAEQLRVKTRPKEDRGLYHGFMRDMLAQLDVGAAGLSPLVALRLQDVFAHFRMVRILEARLDLVMARLMPAEGGEGEVLDKDFLALVEAVAKARERLRKSMKDLEDAGGKAGVPVSGGIADIMAPLFEEYGDVLDPANPHYPVDRSDQSDQSEGKSLPTPSSGGGGAGGEPGNAGIPARSSGRGGIQQIPAVASSFDLRPFHLLYGLSRSLRAGPRPEAGKMSVFPGPPPPAPPPEEEERAGPRPEAGKMSVFPGPAPPAPPPEEEERAGPRSEAGKMSVFPGPPPPAPPPEEEERAGMPAFPGPPPPAPPPEEDG